MKTKTSWKFIEHSRNVHEIRITLPHVGDEQWVLLQSDVHWDNPHCDRKKFKSHLDLALKRNAPVIDVGDFFCAMQGKYDKRASKNEIRMEHCKGDYLDSLVNTAAEYLTPYKDILTVRALGNHETSIYKRHETDLCDRLAEKLRAAGGIARKGGFSGYVKIGLCQNGISPHDSKKLWYFHGAGGGGPVTRGVIQTNRQAVYVGDADFVVTGHTHDSFQLPIERIRLNMRNEIEFVRQTHIKCPGYKDEFRDGYAGWHIERGGPPKPTGAWWLRFVFSASPKASAREYEYEIIEAK